MKTIILHVTPLSPFEQSGNLQQQKAVQKVKDMVDLQGPFLLKKFFFSCQTEHNCFNNSFQEKFGKILKCTCQNWTASYNMNDYRRVSCGKTSWSLNFNHMNISWFWLHMEIFAICLHLKLECEWRKIKGEESIGGIKKRLRNSTWIGERISLNWIKVYGFGQSSLMSLLRLCRMLILFLYWH